MSYMSAFYCKILYICVLPQLFNQGNMHARMINTAFVLCEFMLVFILKC